MKKYTINEIKSLAISKDYELLMEVRKDMDSFFNYPEISPPFFKVAFSDSLFGTGFIVLNGLDMPCLFAKSDVGLHEPLFWESILFARFVCNVLNVTSRKD